MAVSAVVSWAASRSAAVVIDGADLGWAVVGLGAGGTVVAALSGGAGGLTSDRLPPEQAATSRPAANRATSRWIWR
jgi:hypothetical protein